MTTAQEVESTIDECNTAPVVNKYLRQYAEMIQKYEDAVAENVRLREAMNKYSEEPVQTIGGNDPEYLAEVFWRNKDRRIRGERRVGNDYANMPIQRSKQDRRKK